MKKVAILFYPNLSKRSKKTSLIPIYMRIGTYSNKEANIDIYLNDKEVSLWNPILMRIDSPDSTANKLLNKLSTKIEEIKTRHYPDFNKLSPLQIKNEINEDDHWLEILEKDEEYRPLIIKFLKK